jgi:hypothetical protein
VEQASKKGARKLLHDFALPRLEENGTLVLSAGTVLREQARPVPPGHGRDHAPWHKPGVRSAARFHQTHQCLDASVVLDVLPVVVHMQLEDTPAALGDVSVA